MTGTQRATILLLVGLLMGAPPVIAPVRATDSPSAYIDVAWAPGDGKEALERALSHRFLDHGFTVVGTPTVGAYEIQGVVRLTPADRGKETVRIDWTVFGPEGARLGNVTQMRTIRKDSLDNRWGPAAEAAATAAAQDILKLLQQ